MPQLPLGAVSNEVLATVISAIVVVLVAFGIALARVREQVARLEEWARQHDRWHNGKSS